MLHTLFRSILFHFSFPCKYNLLLTFTFSASHSFLTDRIRFDWYRLPRRKVIGEIHFLNAFHSLRSQIVLLLLSSFFHRLSSSHFSTIEKNIFARKRKKQEGKEDESNNPGRCQREMSVGCCQSSFLRPVVLRLKSGGKKRNFPAKFN